MRLDAVVERRLLVNYRTDPDVTARLLPASLRPQLQNGYAVAGICLIRLGRLRFKGLPAVGLRSENAAHRIAVEWDTPDGVPVSPGLPSGSFAAPTQSASAASAMTEGGSASGLSTVVN